MLSLFSFLIVRSMLKPRTHLGVGPQITLLRNTTTVFQNWGMSYSRKLLEHTVWGPTAGIQIKDSLTQVNSV